MSRCPRGDRGSTLLEVLIATALLGMITAALLGALGTVVIMSDTHRKQATAGTTARDYAEAIQNTVATTGYVSCAGSAAYAPPPSLRVPPGFTASVVSVQYWSGSAWQATCSSDTGLQRITVQVASTDARATEQIAVVLRMPCTQALPC
jgi:prepilin-type N-terminal cleavage/methylation domain-containing protein